jgi:hypothetical protein
MSRRGSVKTPENIRVPEAFQESAAAKQIADGFLHPGECQLDPVLVQLTSQLLQHVERSGVDLRARFQSQYDPLYWPAGVLDCFPDAIVHTIRISEKEYAIGAEN